MAVEASVERSLRLRGHPSFDTFSALVREQDILALSIPFSEFFGNLSHSLSCLRSSGVLMSIPCSLHVSRTLR